MSAHSQTTNPSFINEIVQEIAHNDIAIKMSYPDRIDQKVNALLVYFSSGTKNLKPFLESVLFNISIKASHLENSLKFMDKMSEKEKMKSFNIFALLWPQRDEDILKAAADYAQTIFHPVGTCKMGQDDIIRELEKEDGLTNHQLAHRTKIGIRSISSCCKTIAEHKEIYVKVEKSGRHWVNRWYLKR